jgi:hypothetical protein
MDHVLLGDLLGLAAGRHRGCSHDAHEFLRQARSARRRLRQPFHHRVDNPPTSLFRFIRFPSSEVEVLATSYSSAGTGWTTY